MQQDDYCKKFGRIWLEGNFLYSNPLHSKANILQQPCKLLGIVTGTQDLTLERTMMNPFKQKKEKGE
jgi:hypothetical protein